MGCSAQQNYGNSTFLRENPVICFMNKSRLIAPAERGSFEARVVQCLNWCRGIRRVTAYYDRESEPSEVLLEVLLGEAGMKVEVTGALARLGLEFVFDIHFRRDAPCAVLFDSESKSTLPAPTLWAAGLSAREAIESLAATLNWGAVDEDYRAALVGENLWEAEFYVGEGGLARSAGGIRRETDEGYLFLVTWIK